MACITVVGYLPNGPYAGCVLHLRLDTAMDVTQFFEVYSRKCPMSPLNMSNESQAYAQWEVPVKPVVDQGLFGVCEAKDVADVLGLYRDIVNSDRPVYNVIMSGGVSVAAGRVCLLPVGYSAFMKNASTNFHRMRFTIRPPGNMAIEAINSSGSVVTSTSVVRSYLHAAEKIFLRPPGITEPVVPKLKYPIDVWS